MPELALFPLNTVLFPGGALPLRIFETRYLDMISRCLKEGRGFGVCLIREGGETGPAKFHMTGTVAEIGDWSRGEDGLLHIFARGTQRFRLSELRQQGDGLNLGEAELLAEPPPVAPTESQRSLAELLRQIAEQLGMELPGSGAGYDDAAWIAYRLAELMPISLPQRQYLLEVSDPGKRLDILTTLVQSLATS